jgi:LL-diaminopimelate aminotransferase
MRSIGLDAPSPKATFYVWCPVPPGYSSADFCTRVLEEAGIVTTPGNGFGDPGEGYFRMALTVPVERMNEVVDRLKKIL